MICVDVKMRRCEDEKMWWSEDDICRSEDREDVTVRWCEDEKMLCVDVKMGRCEEDNMIYRPPLLEEPFAQTLSGKMHKHVCFTTQSEMLQNKACIWGEGENRERERHVNASADLSKWCTEDAIKHWSLIRIKTGASPICQPLPGCIFEIFSDVLRRFQTMLPSWGEA